LRATAYNMLSALCYRPSVHPSVCHMVDQSKTVEVRIMKFSPHGSPIPLEFCGVSRAVSSSMTLDDLQLLGL